VRLAGRDREQGVLARLLERVPRRGGALVVHGEPGIGKTTLLSEATRAAAARGMLVLRTSGVQPEANLPYAGLHQLLRPVLGCAAGLPPRLQAALGAAFGMEEAAPDPFLTALASLQLLSETAARAPMVLAADDTQWLDRPTADVLAFIARRLDSDPVLLLAAIRDGYHSPLLGAGLPALQLDGLAAAPARELLDNASPGLAPGARGRVLAEARGNPLALAELAAALAARDRAAATPGRLPLTRRLEQAFAARAAELPPAARALLLIAAADDHSALGQVMQAAAIITGTGTGPTVSDLVLAVEAHLIDADDHALRFRHPLVRSAVYQAATVADRHAAHSALAKVLADHPDRQAWHRAAVTTGPDPDVAAELEEAARRARARGAITTAAAAFERAAALTLDPGRRGALLLSAAEAARELGHADQTARLLRAAGDCPLTSRDKAYATWLGDAFGEEDGHAGAPVIVHALAVTARQMAAEKDKPLALNLLFAAASRCHWADLGAPAADEVLSAADSIGASPDDPLLLHIQACAAPLTRGPAVLDYLGRTVPSDDPEALYLLGTAASLAGDYHGSGSLLAASVPRLREQGRLRLLTHALAARAWAAIMTADYRTARPAAEEAGRLAAETAQPLWQATAQAAQAALAALRGDQPATDRLAARVEEVMPPAAGPLSLVQYARGLAALGQGQHADAWAHLRRIYDPGDPACNHRNMCGAIADLAEAAAHAGHHDDAREILGRLRPVLNQAPWLRAATACAIDQLTPQELQIIHLAAEGMSNREIGQRLYLSHRTVESHLYRVYPKLGITSRVQLPRIVHGLPVRPAAV
jgi:DNA-binding CsgD family transcriptional regulator